MATEGKRRLLVIAALLGWVVVVLVGAGSRSDETALLGVDNVGNVFFFVLVLLALAGLVLIVLLNPFRGEWTQPERRRNGTGFLLFLALALVVWRPQLIENLVQDEEQVEEPAAEGVVVDLPESADQGPAETVAQATDIMLLAAGIAIVAGLWLFARRRTVDGEVVEVDADRAFEADLAVAMEHASQELATTLDPRTAVLQAYVILESTLASRGARRLDAETPSEHVRRALRDLRVNPAPIAQLGSLYEIARFSDEVITGADQQQAAEALDRARADLMAAT